MEIKGVPIIKLCQPIKQSPLRLEFASPVSEISREMNGLRTESEIATPANPESVLAAETPGSAGSFKMSTKALTFSDESDASPSPMINKQNCSGYSLIARKSVLGSSFDGTVSPIFRPGHSFQKRRSGILLQRAAEGKMKSPLPKKDSAFGDEDVENRPEVCQDSNQSNNDSGVSEGKISKCASNGSQRDGSEGGDGFSLEDLESCDELTAFEPTSSFQSSMNELLIRPVASSARRNLAGRFNGDNQNDTPVKHKRSQADQRDNNGSSKRTRLMKTQSTYMASHEPSKGFCRSQSEAIIKHSVEVGIQDNCLVADRSCNYLLPFKTQNHKCLMPAISPETLSNLLDGHFDKDINSFTIVDCRYPYEYDGGHITGAVNAYTTQMVDRLFFSKPDSDPRPDGKRNILIFHCEFSSERGPKMAKFLRTTDRKINAERYPFLYYPEVYILERGYKEFFQSGNEKQCVPQSYLPMLDKRYTDDLRKFRFEARTSSKM